MILIGIKTSYIDPQSNQPVDVRLSSRPFESDGDQWLPRIVAGSDPEIRLAVQAPWSRGRITASYGSIDVANPDGALDAWMDGIWTNQQAEVRVGNPGQAWQSWTLVGIARMEHPEYIDGRILRLKFRDRIEDLEGAVQKHFFDGAPNSDLDGQHKPMIVGFPKQLPALVYDEVSTTEIYYYVADNFYPRAGVGWVREGLAPIYEGTGPGQFQDWPPYGFRLNSQPTLPITVDGTGPRYQPMPVTTGRFLKWHLVSDGSNDWELPERWIDTVNFLYKTRHAARVPGTNNLEVVVNNHFSGWVEIRSDVPLEGSTEHVIRWKAVTGQGHDNKMVFRIRTSDHPTGGTVTLEYNGTVDFAQSDSIAFTTPPGTRYMRLQFIRDAVGANFSALFSALWIEQLDEPAQTLDQIIPYLVCERGVLDGADESGPFDYADVDHDALEAATAATGYLELGHYWQDASTHRDLLDLLFRSCDVAWWIDRTARLTCAPFLLNDDASVATFDDTNRTTRIEVAPSPAEGLTDSFAYMRHFKTVPDGEAADTVSEEKKAAGSKEYGSTRRADAGPVNNLHPDYRHAIGAEPDKTALVGPGGTALPDRANRRLQDHAERIQYWRVEGILSTDQHALIQPMKNITLISPRLGLQGGKKVQVVDVRIMPVSGRVQIIARG